MANTTVHFRNVGGDPVPVKAVDNGDDTYSLSTALVATPTIDIGDVTLLAGEAHVGAVGGNSVIVEATPTLTVAASYAANDYVGTSSVPITFTNCARAAAGSGTIISAVLVDYALQSVAMELWLFDTLITPPADSAAWTISDAHAAKCQGVIPFNTYYASALNSVAPGSSLGRGFVCAAADRNLYGCLVTRGAPAFATGDLTVRLMILQD